MARSGWSTSNYLSYAGVPDTTAPFTVSMWLYPTALTAFETCFSLADTVNDYFYRMYIRGDQADDPLRWEAFTTSGVIAELTAVLSVNTWSHVCGVEESSTSRYVWCDGTKSSQNVSDRSITCDETYIGLLKQSTLKQPFPGRIAEVAMWNAALLDNEIKSLAGGINPSRVRAGALVAYWPIWGGYSPEPDYSSGGNSLTVTGTLAKANHPPVGAMALMDAVPILAGAAGEAPATFVGAPDPCVIPITYEL